MQPQTLQTKRSAFVFFFVRSFWTNKQPINLTSISFTRLLHWWNENKSQPSSEFKWQVDRWWIQSNGSQEEKTTTAKRPYTRKTKKKKKY